MNLVKVYVTEVIDEPYYKYSKWCIKVKAELYERTTEHELMFDSKDECLDIKEGYTFLA